MKECNSVTPYDAWLHWSGPTAECNLNCFYCSEHKKQSNKFNIFKKKSPLVKSIDIGKLVNTLEKTNKIFKISFAGKGEPFLIPNIVELCEKLSLKHYLAFNSNLTSNSIKEFVNRINLKHLLYIVASLHTQELQKKRLIQAYIQNFHLCLNAGISISAKEVAHPLLKEKVYSLKKFYKDKGISILFDPFIGEYLGQRYPQAYTPEEIEIFELNTSNTPAKDLNLYQFKCNAGYNVASIDESGNIFSCPTIHESLGNIYTSFEFNTGLTQCKANYCICPLYKHEPLLYAQALKQLNLAFI